MCSTGSDRPWVRGRWAHPSLPSSWTEPPPPSSLSTTTSFPRWAHPSLQSSWTQPPPPSSLSTTTSFPSEEVPLLRSPLHIDLHKQNEEATRLQYWRDLGAVEEQRREETRTGGSRNCFSHDCNFCVLQGKSESGGNLVSTFTFSFFLLFL